MAVSSSNAVASVLLAITSGLLYLLYKGYHARYRYYLLKKKGMVCSNPFQPQVEFFKLNIASPCLHGVQFSVISS